MVDRGKLRQLFVDTELGVISTINADGSPESAIVGVTFLANKQEMIIGTSNQSRKYRNLKANPSASFAMSHQAETLQVEGSAIILEHDTAEFSKYSNEIIKVHPAKIKHANKTDQVWIIIRPAWMRYTNVGDSPWKIEEEIFNEAR